MTSQSVLRPLTAENRDAFRRMVQDYMAEIAPGLDVPTPGQMAKWWTNADRHAFEIATPEMVGFALVLHLSDGSHELSEFYIVPDHRRSGLGRAAVAELVPRFPGRWRLGLASGSANARTFWPAALKSCSTVSRILRGPPLTPHQTGSLHFIVKENT